jgi:hypothetical protein
MFIVTGADAVAIRRIRAGDEDHGDLRFLTHLILQLKRIELNMAVFDNSPAQAFVASSKYGLQSS